jgi:hypothetical protein
VVEVAQKKRALPQFTADVEGSKAINGMRATHEREVSHQPVGRAWEMKTAQQQYSEERRASRKRSNTGGGGMWRCIGLGQLRRLL